MAVIINNQVSWASKLRKVHRPLAFLAVIPLLIWLGSGIYLINDNENALALTIHRLDVGTGIAQSFLLYAAIAVVSLVSLIGLWLIFYSFDPNDKRNPQLTTLRVLHKWLGCLVAVQLIIWIITALGLSVSGTVDGESNLFYTLHLMGYVESELAQNTLLMSMSSLALLLVVVGLVMLLAIVFGSLSGRVMAPKNFQVVIYSSQGNENITVEGGQPLLAALALKDYSLPSGCGGSGTCCQCRVKAVRVSNSLSGQEHTSLTPSEINQGYRLACQIEVNSDLAIEVSNQTYAQQEIEVDVVSCEFVTPFIKELVVNIPYGTTFSFEAGQFVNVLVPPFSRSIKQLSIPKQYQPYWQQQRLGQYQVVNSQRVERSYSMASSPANGNKLVFNIGLALPKKGYGPGVASTYMFGLKVGDRLTLSGPLGDFVAASDSQREMVFVGAGTGMAPLKSHIDSMTTAQPRRKISLWFGARTQDDIFYQSHFDFLARRNQNFSWTVALSKPDERWQGATGHIQQTLFSDYLDQHPQLTECDFFLCGPPLMMRDTTRLLQRKGVSESQILCDEFT